MENKNKTILKGIVVSDKMNKTIIIETSRLKQHSKYKKVYKVNRKIKVHDEKNIAKIGDEVTAVSVRPKSKEKSFILVKIIKKHD
jgi:small subunit ribosomal protein S17